MSAEALLISIRARKTATWRRHEGTYKKARNVQIETIPAHETCVAQKIIILIRNTYKTVPRKPQRSKEQKTMLS